MDPLAWHAKTIGSASQKVSDPIGSISLIIGSTSLIIGAIRIHHTPATQMNKTFGPPKRELAYHSELVFIGTEKISVSLPYMFFLSSFLLSLGSTKHLPLAT